MTRYTSTANSAFEEEQIQLPGGDPEHSDNNRNRSSNLDDHWKTIQRNMIRL